VKNEDLLVVGLAGIAVFLILKAKGLVPGFSGAAANPAPLYAGSEVFNGALPSQPGYGWHYYTDGVAIGPDGRYYLNGKEVWAP